MTRFNYRALGADGGALNGQLEAVSRRDAYRELTRRGARPIAITQSAPSVPGGTRRRRNAGRHNYLYVLKELHVLVASGVPLAEAVAALESAAAHPSVLLAFGELHTGLRRGEHFATAFGRCFPTFPSYIHRIIETGELSGRLAEALADAAAEVEREARFRAELRNALIYPMVLIAAGVLAILFMFIVVVPRFAVVFRGKYDELPFVSYVVIAGGMWVHDHLMIGAVVIAVAGVVLAYVGRQSELRERWLATVRRLPLLNGWLRDIDTARWAAVLARLLENRVPLMQSLELAGRALRGGEAQVRMAQVERAVRTGTPLAVALDHNHVLPSTALSLIRVGERSGNLPAMARSVAAIYDEIVRNRVKAILAIIEPAAIVAIGGVIGLVATAIFLAITSINKLPGL